jgi:hypothetical protein
MWPFFLFRFLYSCVPGFTFHAEITPLQISYSFTCLPPHTTLNLTWDHPFDVYISVPLSTGSTNQSEYFPLNYGPILYVLAGDFVGIPCVKTNNNVSEMSEV